MTRHLLPTGRGWLLLAAVPLSLMVARINHSSFALLLSAGCAGFWLASLAAALLSLRGLRVERLPAGDAWTGARVDLPLRIVNRSWLPRLPLVVLERIPFVLEPESAHVVPALRCRGEEVLHRRVLASLRGDFRLGDLKLRSGDPAGLFYRERRLRLPEQVMVLPSAQPLPDLLLRPRAAATGTTVESISHAGTSQDFYGVREYQSTDGMRHINWRSSAHRGQLMVTEFERSSLTSVAIVLDAHEDGAGKGPSSNLERQVLAAASLVEECAGLYCSLAFAAGGDALRVTAPATAASLRQELLAQLAVLRPGPHTVTEALEALIPTLPPRSILFCLSLAPDPTLETTLTALAESGIEVRWSAARAGHFPGATRRQKRECELAEQVITQPYAMAPVDLLPADTIERGLLA